MSETPNEYDDLLDGADHPWRKRLIALAVLGALIAAGAYALWATLLGGGGSTVAEAQTATVEQGSISQTVSTTGVAVAQSTADLAFEQAGTVSTVNVALGQEVKQGDVLAEIESDDLESALTTAEVNLDSAQAKLDDLLAGSTASELASADQSVVQAQSALDQAESALEDLLDGATASELRQAEQAVAAAESQLTRAQEARAKLYTDSEDAIAAAEEAVSKAEDALASAESAAADADDNVTLARLSLLSAGDTYCDTDGNLDDICDNFDVPLSSTDIQKLTDSIEDEITASSAVQAGPEPTPAVTVVPTAVPTAVPTQESSSAQSQQETGSELVSAATNLISANTAYNNVKAARSSADEAVLSAEEALEAAQEDLAETRLGPSAADIAAADVSVGAAQLALDDAKDKLDELKAGATEDDLADAQNNVDAAEAALTSAKAKRDDVYDGADAQEISLQREQVRQAELAVKKARENLENTQLIAPFDGTAAELNIEVGDEVSAGGAGTGTSTSGSEAAIVLNTPNALRLQLSVTESDVLSLEVDQTGYATFDAIDNATFPIQIESVGTSPTTTQGVVTYEVWARVLSAPAGGLPGASSRGSQTAILSTAAELLGMTEEELQAALASGQTLVEVAEVHGMSAEDFQSALMQQARGSTGSDSGTPEPTATPTAEVTPSGSDSESTDATATSSMPLPGMNATVTIIVDSAQNVLVVPEAAIQTEGRNSVVEVQKDDGTTEKVTVQTGLSDGSNIEVTDGLEEGLTVLVPTRTTSSTETTDTGFPQGGFIISGEGGPPSGGGAGPNIQVGP